MTCTLVSIKRNKKNKARKVLQSLKIGWHVNDSEVIFVSYWNTG